VRADLVYDWIIRNTGVGMKKRLGVMLVVAIAVGACGGGQAVTEKRMLEWGPILNMYMGTNVEGGNSYPESLDEMPPEITTELERRDGWGNRFLYRRLRIDKYNLISAGPDGEFGNADDIVMENGALYDATKIYSERPLK
jgi:hypothetical protein